MAIGLLAAACFALLVSAAYTRWWNPEIRLYCHAVRVKQQWAAELDRRFTNKTIICGGSSTSFAVDPARMLDRNGIAVANYGLHAGMQPWFLVAFAAAAARPGDLLLVALEPELLLATDTGSDLAAQMAFALDRPRWAQASDLTGEPVHWVENLVSLRPGAYHFFTLLGKLTLGRPLYRYHPSDFSPAGWQQTAERRPVSEPGRWSGELSPGAARLLQSLDAWGRQQGVRVGYLLPWRYAGEEHARPFQFDNLAFLEQVARYLPVLADERLGAYGVRGQFADTPFHLTSEGAAIRSDELADDLLAGRFWSVSDLGRLRAGWSRDYLSD
ncbi:MAG: hypothetical protein H7A45_21040 [Verrucomicrobiales bacterium]|nr:hypothetical protein [Verrucomicrobiales bacterium]